MKVFVGGIIQETNTFSPRSTDLDAFRRGYLLHGGEIETRLRGTNTEFGGFLDELSPQTSVRAKPGLAAWAVAAGPLAAETFDHLSRELVDSLRERLPVDAVLLALHGALVSDGCDDCDGALLRRVREVVGPDVPVVSTLDYHACVTGQMLECADVLVGYRTYPHVDFAETGKRAARIALRLARGCSLSPSAGEACPERSRRGWGEGGVLGEAHCVKPTCCARKLPLILPVENTETEAGPMSDAVRLMEELERQPGILSASLFCPQPWLDVPENGVSAVAYSTGDSPPADSLRQILGAVWDRRLEFFQPYPTVEQFLNEVSAHESPTVVVDSGDITSAGGMGDSTHILRALLAHNLAGRAVVPVVDPKAVDTAFRVGLPCRCHLRLGLVAGAAYNAAIDIDARVLALSDSPVDIKGPSFSGLSIDSGRRALVRIGESLDVLLCEYASLVHDPEVLRSMGADPAQYDLIVQKSHKLFRAAYKDIARSIVILDTPGHTSMNLGALPFSRINRPIYPLDEANWGTADK